MSFLTSVLFSLSIGIGAVLGGVRFRRIDLTFRPFLIYLWCGFLNEGLSVLLLYRGYSNVINYNLFLLVEMALIGYQFFLWKLMTARRWIAYCLLATGWWVAENFWMPQEGFNSYFAVAFSFVLVLLSIGTVNRLLFREASLLAKNSVFLICIAFIFYFSFSALIETFWIFGVRQSASFRLHINNLFNYINLFTNLVYAFAVLWIPMKRDFILPC